MQFQIKLYEGTNTIEFVYGAWTATTSTPDYQQFLSGLKANALSSGTTITQADLAELSLLFKAPTQAWSTTAFTNTFTSGGQAYISGILAQNSVLPDAGRTYRFRVVPATDAAVQYIYALGKTQPGTPQIIRAVVRNLGSSALTNLAVVLNVAGANTFTNAVTVPSLAVGASTVVTFPAFTPTAVGTNTITVSVPADGGTTNDTQTYSQQIQNTTFAQYNPAQTTSTNSIGFGTGAGIIAVKFNTPAARTATSVAARIGGGTTSVGNTVYGVILDANGAIVGRSANYTIAAADLGTIKSFTLTTPAVLATGDFYAGLAQTANATTGYFPIASQEEAPTRTGVVYAVPLAGGAPTDVTTAPANANIGLPVIEAVVNLVQGTSAALNRAISMYPNPSTGVVKLDVRGANAKGQLHVQVINLLGQVVYTSSLQDNFTNEVNLSGLAGGIYTLKVQTGSEFTSRQLVLTK
ncbi:T9SS type A sorting domain-containing protein [Hymenobacter telluris]|nr:T9SS type A sorting domain-containing protein [Hymenobacter telluris]